MNIEKFTEWIGEETHPEKRQYVRGVARFTCPTCGRSITSAGYLNFGYFQIAAATHLRECNITPAQIVRAACSHPRITGDNYGSMCLDCGEHWDANELPF